MGATKESLTVGDAYETLLTLAPGSLVRLRLQDVLCTLRDEIAGLEGRDPEAVQNEYEERAVRWVVFTS